MTDAQPGPSRPSRTRPEAFPEREIRGGAWRFRDFLELRRAFHGYHPWKALIGFGSRGEERSWAHPGRRAWATHLEERSLRMEGCSRLSGWQDLMPKSTPDMSAPVVSTIKKGRWGLRTNTSGPRGLGSPLRLDASPSSLESFETLACWLLLKAPEIWSRGVFTPKHSGVHPTKSLMGLFALTPGPVGAQEPWQVRVVLLRWAARWARALCRIPTVQMTHHQHALL